MNRRALIPLLLCLLAVARAEATDFVVTGRYTLAPGAAITNELWMKAQTVVLEGTAEDDLFLFADGTSQPATNAAPAILLSGVMQADVWGAAESVTLTGTVERHARLLGFKSVSVDGSVGRNLIAAGGAVVLGESATVAGSAVLAGRDVLAHGTVSGDARLYGTQVTVSGRFNGNLTIAAGDINIMPGTHVGGNLYYTMDKDLVLDSNVNIGGRLIKIEPGAVAQPAGLSVGSLLLQAAFYCGALLVGMVFVGLFPGIVVLSLHKLAASFWRCVLIGFVTFCLIPMAAFFLIFTIVGLPLSVLLLFAYLIVVYTGKIITAVYVGHLLLRGRDNPPAVSLLPLLASGLFILYAGGCLPFPIDILLWFAFSLLGLGALVSAMADRRLPVVVASVQNQPPVTPPPLP